MADIIGGGTLAIGSMVSLMGMLNVDTRIFDITRFLRNNRIFPEGILPSSNIDTSVGIGLGAIAVGGGIIYAGAKQLKKNDELLSKEKVSAITEMAFGGSLLLPVLLNLLITEETNDFVRNLQSKVVFIMACIGFNGGQFLSLYDKDRTDQDNTITIANTVTQTALYGGGVLALLSHILSLTLKESNVLLYRNEYRHILFSLLGVAGSVSLTNGTYKLLRD